MKLQKSPKGQFASHGNVCVFPQEPHILSTILPPPINALHEEIAIIFVASAANPVTKETLNKSPLLVHSSCILAALEWLKLNNPLYQSIEISHEVLECDYPEDGAAPGFATVELLKDTASTTEGSSYTAYSMDANDEAFYETQTAVPLTSSGVMDTDHIDDTYHMRKLAALCKIIKGSAPFVKFPSGNQPVKTSYLPTI